MSEDTIKASLLKLKQQLDTTESVDEETLAIAQSLEVDIQKLLDTNEANNIDSSVDIAMSLETRFESKHPTAAGIMRELINALQKMGI